jgi:hypothetical protein
MFQNDFFDDTDDYEPTDSELDAELEDGEDDYSANADELTEEVDPHDDPVCIDIVRHIVGDKLVRIALYANCDLIEYEDAVLNNAQELVFLRQISVFVEGFEHGLDFDGYPIVETTYDLKLTQEQWDNEYADNDPHIFFGEYEQYPSDVFLKLETM